MGVDAAHTCFGLVGAGRAVVWAVATTGALGCGLHLLLGVSVHRACIRGEVRVERVLVGGWRRRHWVMSVCGYVASRCSKKWKAF